MSSMLEYKGYHATIEFDAEDMIFVGEVFGISDSLSFHGSTVEELEKMFAQSIDNYLELCEKIGKSPDKEFKGVFNVRISPELHRKVALAAAEQNVTLNQYVTHAIENSFENRKEVTREIIYISDNIKQVNWNIETAFDLDGYNYSGTILNNEENRWYGRD